MCTFLLIFSSTCNKAAVSLKQIICQRKQVVETLSQKAGLKLEKKELMSSWSLWLQACFLVWSSHGNPSAKPRHKGCQDPWTALTGQPLFPSCIQQEQLPPEKSSAEKSTELTASLTSSCDFNLTFSQIKQNPLDFSRDQMNPIHKSSIWVLNICLSQVSLIKYQRAYGPFIQVKSVSLVRDVAVASRLPRN